MIRIRRVRSLFLRIAFFTFMIGLAIGFLPTRIFLGVFLPEEEREIEDVNEEQGYTLTVGGEEIEVEILDVDERIGSETALNVELIPDLPTGRIFAQVIGQRPHAWYHILVNENIAVPEHFEPVLVEVFPEMQVDERIADSVREMFESASSQGLQLQAISAFRSYERQREIFNASMFSRMEEGLSPLDAFNETRTRVALPGHSEHQLGLALDIVSAHNHALDESQGQTPEGIWLRQNSWRYGFVIRYLPGKTHITGIIYEPWHFRYVGRESARTMWEQGLVLEEYIMMNLMVN